VSLDIADATPFELLARTGGGRATDTFHVVAEPELDGAGRVVTRFLASGIRWVPGDSERVARLAAGAALRVRPEPTTPTTPRRC
jgi:hypothetical protein